MTLDLEASLEREYAHRLNALLGLGVRRAKGFTTHMMSKHGKPLFSLIRPTKELFCVASRCWRGASRMTCLFVPFLNTSV
jgi:hypothetical protein